ncbi:MAG: hypothetical protein AMS18_14345 [Gemmatimonas sp. SG8_17]|nr:MAG: hypothetical protein AMS18_14345 [Gemmatimonas sp. SG8_17]
MAKPVVRLGAVRLAFMLGVAVVLVRSAQVQLASGQRYAETALAQRTERLVLPARRGAIYDRNGVVLAQTVDAYRVGVAPNELRDPERDAEIITAQLKIPQSTVRRQLRQRYAWFGGPFNSAQVQQLRSMRGVHLTGDMVRFHPNPGLAQAILGRPAAEGRLASGIERVVDTLLTGTDGSGVVLRDRQGRRLESPSRLGEFPIPGHDVYLTIDVALQDIVEKALDDALYEFSATTGDVVVLNPNTGEILAVASRTADGRSTTGAFTSVFEPGSTAKVFAAAALLMQGLAQPTDSVWTENGIYVTEHRRIEDDHPNGWLTLQGVIEQSSNIGIVKFANRIPPESQYHTLRSFGLGTPTAVEYPSESAGRLSRPDAWSGITGQSMAMGYEISVTPLQLAQAYAAIANGGVLLRPTLVSMVSAPDGAIVYRHVPEPVRRVVSAEVAEQLRTALRGVVYRGGTGEMAALRGYEVAGKTGTVRRSGPQGYVSGSYTASFVSLFPADRPQLVTVVKLDDPRGTYARVTAVPLTRAVLEQVLAAETQALDRGELAGVAARGELNRAVGQAEVRHVSPWPDSSVADPTPDRPVPNVVGIPLRDAVRRMHEAGLRVQLSGIGSVIDTDPRPGTMVAPGALVRLVVR